MRIRGKNNMISTKTGSVTKTLEEMNDFEAKKSEMARTTERLRVLEKLEKYREDKMRRELEMYEESRRKEDVDIRKHRDSEVKRQKYLEK